MYLASPSPTVKEIKETLLEFHRSKEYRLFEPFPLVSADPTVMFVNATITPFKSWFTDGSIQPNNYALIQGCFRMGGASELDVVGVNPYYFTFFEMFGSGTFNTTHDQAVSYLLNILAVFGVGKEYLYCTIPADERFHGALRKNGIEEERIFQLAENGYFWQEWKFGVPGPVGHGLTVIFSHSPEKIESVEQLIINQDRYVELLNLIHVHSQSLPDGRIVSVANPGFDLGVSIERLAAVLQRCDSYRIDAILPLVQTVNDFISEQKVEPDDIVARICVDHFRAIYVLSAQGLIPANKGHGYVLRKLMRKFLETVWSSVGGPMSTGKLLRNLAALFERSELVVGLKKCDSVAEKILVEEDALLDIFHRIDQVLRRHQEVSPQTLYDTYGISKALLALARQHKHQKKGGES